MHALARTALAIHDIKAHHRVPLGEFDEWVAVFRDAGGLSPLSDTRIDGVGLRICDFGAFDVIGCGPELAEAWGAIDLTVRVSGLRTMVEVVRERGEQLIAGPQLCEQGWRMVARHRDGTVVEYLELS